MATNPVVCPECGTLVPSGRFSCQECGSLLASVVGRAIRPRASVERFEEPALATDEAPATPGGQLVPSGALRLGSATAPDTTVQNTTVSDPVEPTLGFTEATPPTTAQATLAWPPSAAAAVTTPTAAVEPPSTTVPERRSAFGSMLSDELIETPNDAAGWLVRGGALGMALSFLLPWARSSAGVVGTGPIGYGYFDRWALANAWYLLPFFLGLFVFGLAVVPNRLVLWLRSGILPLVAGALALGVVFVYLGGPFGGGPGVAVLALAGVALGVGGVLAIRSDRNGEPPSIV